MKTNLIRLEAIAAGIAMAVLSGCAATAPKLESTFGNSLNTLKLQQTIDSNAAANTDTATLDGKAAHEVLGRYRESYKAPAPQSNVFTIGIGGGK